MSAQHTPGPWEQINPKRAAVLMAALNEYKAKTLGSELAIIADLEAEIPRAFDTVESLYQQRDELLAALIEAREALNGAPNTVGLHNQINSAIAKAEQK